MTRERGIPSRTLFPAMAMAFALIVAPLIGPIPPAAAAARTLTVCASGCDYTTIQAAVNAASAGDTVQIAAGNFVENLTISVPITLKCANAGLPGAGTRGPESVIRGGGSTSPALLITSATGAEIDGCQFLRPLANPLADPRTTVSASQVPKLIESSRGVSAEIRVSNSRFDLSPAAFLPSTLKGCGSAVHGSASWVVSGNHFANQDYTSSGCTSAGLRYSSRTIFAEDSARIHVVGNTFENSGHGVFLTGDVGNGSLIETNSFAGMGQAILVGKPRNTVVRGNSFLSGNGIYLDGSTGTVIEKNLFCGGAGGGVEAPNAFADCLSRIGYSVFEYSSTVTGTLARGNAILGAYPSGFGFYSLRTVFNSGAGAVLEDNWWGQLDPAGIRSKLSSPGADPNFVPMGWITAYTLDPAKLGSPGFWPTCVTMSDPARVIDSEVFPCPQPESTPSVTLPRRPAPEQSSTPEASSPAPGNSPSSSSPSLRETLNAQIRSLPLPAAAIALLEDQLAGVFIDGEAVEARILTPEEVAENAQTLFGASSRVSITPDSQSLVIANFDGTQSLDVNLADVKIIQIGSLRIALVSVGESDGERGRNDDGKVVAQPDDQLVAVATGLPPGAVFRAFFFSTPTDLGTVVADGNGEVLLAAPLPSGTAPGDHTLQLTTSTPTGELAEIAIPVVIAESVPEVVESEPEPVAAEPEVSAEPEVADGSLFPPFLWVVIGGVLLLAVVTAIILAARSRRA